MKKPEAKTTHCVDCMVVAAAHYCGHVVDESTGAKVLAGWCNDCWDAGEGGFVTTNPKRLVVHPGGYVRPWEQAMGKTPWRSSAAIEGA